VIKCALVERLPSMEFSEALFDDVNWPEGISNVEHEPDVDIFDLVETLELDEEMALAEVPLEQSTRRAPLAHALMAQHAAQAPKPAGQRKKVSNNDSQRVERIRARNREAQARYRLKSKVRSRT
jgi:hypothetical protein